MWHKRPRLNSSTFSYSQLLYTTVNIGHWERLTEKKMIHLKYDVRGKLYGYPGLPEGGQVGPRAN